MSDYTVRRSTGETMLIDENTLNREFSVALVGDEYRNFGHNVAQNFINLTSNFAGSVSPDNNPNIHYDSVTNKPPAKAKPLMGQLWFDATAKIIKVYDGDSWDAVTSVIAAVTKDVMPDPNFVVNIGSENNRWHGMYATHLNVSTNKGGTPDPDGKPAITLDGVMSITNTNGNISPRLGKIVPLVKNGVVSPVDLGETLAPFREIHTKALIFNGTAGLSLIGQPTDSFIVPSSSAISLGEKSSAFRRVAATTVQTDLLTAIADVVGVDKHLIPLTGTQVNLGSTSSRYSNVFTNTAVIGNIIGGGNCSAAVNVLPEITSVTNGAITSSNSNTQPAWSTFSEVHGGKFSAIFEPYFGEFNVQGMDRTADNFSYNLISNNLGGGPNGGGTYNLNSNAFFDATGELLYGTEKRPVTTFSMFAGPNGEVNPRIVFGVSHPRDVATQAVNTKVAFGSKVVLTHQGLSVKLFDTDGATVTNSIEVTDASTTFSKKIIAPSIELASGGSMTGKLLGTEGNETTLYIDSVASSAKFMIEGEEFSPVTTKKTNLGSATHMFDAAYVDNIIASTAASLPSTTSVGGTALLSGGKINPTLLSAISGASEGTAGVIEIASLTEAIFGTGGGALIASVMSQLFSFSTADVAVGSGFTAPASSVGRFGSFVFGGMRINMGWIKYPSARESETITVDLTLNGMGGYKDANSYVCIPVGMYDAANAGIASFMVNSSTANRLDMYVAKEGGGGDPIGVHFITIGAIATPPP